MTISVFVYPSDDSEPRVALTPENVMALERWGGKVLCVKGGGMRAQYHDDAYKQAGAKLLTNASEGLNAHIIVTLAPPSVTDLRAMRDGAIVMGLLTATSDDALAVARQKSLQLFALERLPRITRAQGMDVLSSQSNLAGYRAILEAAQHYPRLLPMMMTAAGSIKAARVFVIGAGVAGLQALATARRLGGITSAYDVRAAAAQQVTSVGATFITSDDQEGQQSDEQGGYAREVSASYKKKQDQLLRDHIPQQDIVITTALIPQKKAPVLIDQKMVESMRAGSVIVDIAASGGGNCALTQTDAIVTHKQVTIIGWSNLAARMPHDASFLLGRNITQFITQLFTSDDSQGVTCDAQDDIITATLL